MNRRDFLRTAGGTAGGTAAVSASAGTAAAASGGGGGGGGKPDLGGYLDGVGNFNGVVDKTGKSEVTVKVGVEANGGAFGFGPAAVHVSKGTTVKFEWTGNGGGHNVVNEGGAFDSGSPVAASGVNFEHTFEKGGIFKYYCSPHKSLGMKGAIVVGKSGSDYPVKSSGGGGGGGEANPEHMGVPFQAHFVGIATMLMMVVSLIFTFFLLKYGESPHISGGND